MQRGALLCNAIPDLNSIDRLHEPLRVVRRAWFRRNSGDHHASLEESSFGRPGPQRERNARMDFRVDGDMAVSARLLWLPCSQASRHRPLVETMSQNVRANNKVCVGRIQASPPNPSFEARPNIKMPGPRSGAGYHPLRGPGILLLVSASIQTLGSTNEARFRSPQSEQPQACRSSLMTSTSLHSLLN
jgi:hypothetical protein